jgi:hypothetical protein
MPKPSEKKIAPLSFQIKGIELLETCLIHPKFPIPEFIIFQFDIKLEHKFNIEKRIFSVFVSIEIFDEDHKNKFGSFSVSCNYEIENFNDFVDSRKNMALPDEFVITLNSISLSTARGMMFNQFRGTFLHGACLPIIDPKTFILQKEAL